MTVISNILYWISTGLLVPVIVLLKSIGTPPAEDAGPSSGKGKRVGVAYQLENGDIIYIPE